MAEENYDDDDDFEEDDEAGAAPTSAPPPAAPVALPSLPAPPVAARDASSEFSTASLMAGPEAKAAPKGRGRSRSVASSDAGGGDVSGGGSGGSSAAAAKWISISVSELDLEQPPIAHGAMGAIHAATWRGRPVAAKTLHDFSKAALRALEAELLVHADLAHPNIVTLLGERALAREQLCRSAPAAGQADVVHAPPSGLVLHCRPISLSRRRQPHTARLLRRDGAS